MSILSRPLTFADLERARETRDERLELIEGEIVVTPSPSPMHQIISHRLEVLLDRAVVEPGLGLVISAPLDVFFEEESVFQPDLIVLLHDREQLFGDTFIEGAPSLVIEILSSSTGEFDRGRKRVVYARHGVPEYWIIDPIARTVEILSDPARGQYRSARMVREIAASVTIPSLAIDLPALFASPRRSRK